MVTQSRRDALSAGRDAAIAARFHGAGLPANPHREGTVRNLYWQWGAERALKLIREIDRIG